MRSGAKRCAVVLILAFTITGCIHRSPAPNVDDSVVLLDIMDEEDWTRDGNDLHDLDVPGFLLAMHADSNNVGGESTRRRITSEIVDFGQYGRLEFIYRLSLSGHNTNARFTVTFRDEAGKERLLIEESNASHDGVERNRSIPYNARFLAKRGRIIVELTVTELECAGPDSWGVAGLSGFIVLRQRNATGT